MPINPKQMQAWANQGSEEEASDEEVETAAKEAEEKEGEESEEEEAAEGTLEEQFPNLFPLLEEYGDLVEEACDTLDQELLLNEDSEWDEENQELLEDAIDTLPRELKKAIKKDAKEIAWDKAQEIASALEAGEHIEDAECVAGFIYWASKNV